MTTPIRNNIGIAIDGGGIKGLLVAHGIIALEKKLGLAEGQPLISHPSVKVLAGTSTGSIITSALAIGMTGQQILKLYQELGDEVFSKAEKLRPLGTKVPLLSSIRPPIGLVNAVRRIPQVGDVLLYFWLSARYSMEPLQDAMLRIIKTQTTQGYAPNNDPTLGQMGAALRNQPGQPTLIITTVEVGHRKTHFLKTTSTERSQDLRLVEAMGASSAIPTYWLPRQPKGFKATHDHPDYYLIDGGVGSFGNPAYVAAWELCSPRNTKLNSSIDPPRQFDPSTVTVFSFGTGYLPTNLFLKAQKSPLSWWALKWVRNLPELFTVSAVTQQSRDVVNQFTGIDFRRFQLEQPKNIGADDLTAIPILEQMGVELAARVEHDHFAQPGHYDPEGIFAV